MKATMKRIVSIVLALAMVIAGMNYTPKAVEAADYSGLSYTAITNNQNSEFSQTLYNSQYAVYEGESPNTILYQNTSFNELYFAYSTMAAPITATVNGQSISTEGTGVRMYDAANYLTYEYNVVYVVDTNGKTSTIIIYCPANAGKGTYEGGMEQGSQDPGETESQNYDDLNWIAVNYGGYPQYEGMYDYYILSGTAVTNVDVLQAPAWGEGHVGLYVILVDVPTTILINGVEHTGDASDDGDEVQGAGVLLNVSAFTQYINTIEFTCSNGAVGTLLIRNNSIDPDAEGSTTTADQSTTADSSTTAEGTQLEGSGVWMGTLEAEGWSYYEISDNGDGYTLTNKSIGSSWYSIQTFSPVYNLTAGTTYYCTFTLTADNPKAYTVDFANGADHSGMADDTWVFDEIDSGAWTQNADGTWSTTFVGTYTVSSGGELMVRVSLGYHHNDDPSHSDAADTYYNAWDTGNFTLSGFEFYEISDSETPTPTESQSESQSETQAQGSDDDYDWIQVANSSIYWYYTESSDLHGFQWESHGDDWAKSHSGIYIYSQLAAISQVFVNGEEHDNDGVYDEIDGAGVLINDEALTQHINTIVLVDVLGNSFTVLIRNDAVSSSEYAPTGLAASVSGSTATIIWSNSSATEEIDASRVQYVLTVNGTEYNVQSDGTLSVSIDLSSLSYGTYTATLDTYVDGTKVDTQSTSFNYSDPYAVESTVTFKDQQESKRRVRINWTAVANVTGYAIYVDGNLVDTTDADATQYDLYSYLLSDNINEAGQATSAGAHHIAVVALFDNEEAPSSIEDVNSSRIMGEFDDTWYVNYIWGKTTDLWNDTGVDCPWNFTISEEVNPDGSVTAGSSATITYNDDGSATITPAGDDEYINMGTHGWNTDQEWMLKAAIYDEYVGVGEWINLSFTITVPGDTWDLDSDASDRTIKIKCIAEECDDDGEYLADNIYDESDYTFEYNEETDTWQIHYSLTVESANDTYDLFFGLGKLKISEITLSDVIHTTLYGLTSLTPSGVYNMDDEDNSSIYVSWTSDIPTSLTNEYTFKVYIASYDASKSDDDQDFVEITLPGNVSTMSGEEVSKLVSGLLYSGYAPGEYVVKVESYYIYDDRTPTSSLTAHATIENTNKADLIISSMAVTDDNWNSDAEFHIGDTITVTYTMTNIGTADAVSTGDTLMAGRYYYKYDENGNLVGTWYGWDQFNDETKTLAAGESVTASFKIVISEDWVDSNGFLYLGIWADSDKHVEESNDDNNTYIITIHPFAAESVLELENNGENVVATWPEVSESDKEQATKMYIEYTDYYTGETVRVQLDSLDETSYTFPADVYLPNESIVSIFLELEDGETIHYAEGQALADLVMVEISADTYPVYTGESINITGVVKNIGTGVASTTDVINVTLSGSISCYGGIGQVVLVNEEVEFTTNSGFTSRNFSFDTAGDYSVHYYIDDRNNVKESDRDNNQDDFVITVVDELELDLVNNGENVVATWPELSDTWRDGAVDLWLEYTDYETGETKSVQIGSLDATEYTFPEDAYIKNNTAVYVYVELEDGTMAEYAKGTALADLVMIEIAADTDPLYPNDATTITGVVKNIGTAVAETTDVIQIMFHSDDAETSSLNGYYLPTNESTILVNGTSSFTTKNITISTAGEYEVSYQVDERNNIRESDEDNNWGSFTITVVEKEYGKMDWTLLTSQSGGQGDVYDFSVNGGGYTANIEYKILDTSYEDQDWDTIFTNYSGYNGNWMAMSIDGSDNIFTSGETTGTAGVGTTTRTYFSQSDSTFCNYYDDSIDATDFEALLEMGYTLHSYQNMAVYDTEGNVLLNAGEGDSSMVDNGNGFNYFVNSWGVGKYYVMYIVDTNGDYIVVAFHVTGDENGWVQAKASDGTDVDNLDVYYHEDDCKTTGSYYYDASDHGLSYIGVYNGGWFSLVLDESAGLQGASSNCAVYLGYASVDEDGNFVTPEIGDYLSYCNDITSLVYNFEGMNTFQFNIDVITKDLPVHSDREVNPDSEYYYMVIYPDLTNNPDYYVAIPIMVRADIPEIEEVAYDAMLAIGGDDENVLSVSLSENATQSRYDYRYQISVYDSEDAYNNGEDAIVESEEYSHNDGSYFEGFTYTLESESVYVVVTTMWCDQVVTNGITVIAEDDSGWRLISGESDMYVTLNDSNIYGTLYWNKDIKSNHAYDITGWNGTYLGITGNSKYYDAVESDIEVSISEAMPTAASASDVNVEELTYGEAEVIGGSDEQIQVNTEDFISAKYQVTYYVVKVEQGGVTNYIEMCATVATGDVKIAGFQMNTDTSEGAVSEFGPSFRIVSDVARVLPIDEGSDYSGDYENTRYEFEDGTIVGDGYSIEVAPNFSPYEGYHNDLTGQDGGAAVGGLNEWPNNGRKYVSTTVDVDTEGVYMLTICYAEGADVDGETGGYHPDDYCNIDIRVNGSDWASLETQVTNNWETTTTVQTPIVLKAGENVIDVTGASYVWDDDMAEGHSVIEWVNLDYFEIQMTNPQIDTVASYGTIYTVNDDVDSSDMKYDDLASLPVGESTEISEGIYAYPATKDVGVTSKWASTDLGGDLQTFALTIKPEAWLLDMLDTDFTIRSYAITSSGKIIYSDNSTDSARKVVTTSIYDIAENLYNGNKMGTQEAHEYLYDNVLNQIAIRDHRSAICNSMLKAIGITTTSDSRYDNVNTIYKDMYYFVYMQQSYASMKYYERGAFTSQDADNEATVLGWLNSATGTSYSTLSEWIENETESVDQHQYSGYYKRVAYTGSGYNNTVVGDGKE